MHRFPSAVAVAAAVLCGIGALAPTPREVRGQDAASSNSGLVSRGPQFLVTTAGGPQPIDIERTPALRERIELDLDRVTLDEALATIAKKAGIRLVYSQATIDLGKRVSFRSDRVSVAAALTEILLDTKVDVLFGASGRQAVLVNRRGKDATQAGSVVGKVTDAKTGDRLAGAEAYLEGTKWRTSTGDNGAYRLTDVAVGTYTLVIRRLGYTKRTRSVAVVADQEVTVDVGLEPLPTQLNELVTTVTGEQRRLELGHVIGVINADSLVKAAPISSLSELLTSRIPGLLVQQTSGGVGGEVRLRMRSLTTATLGTEPILIVDGVRIQNSPYVGAAGDGSSTPPYELGPFGHGGSEPTSRLNDINPNDIESVEIVKGPSAATLYGTDAANGVIVITTKRGRPGPTRWNSYGRATRSTVPEYKHADLYWAWNDEFGTSMPCLIDYAVAGYCVTDSITVLPNPLNDKSQTIYAPKPQWEYGLDASGGHSDLRYYIGGDFQRQTGPVQLPKGMEESLKLSRGVSKLPDELLNPNTQSRNSFRTNLNASAGDKADLFVNSGYVQNTTSTLTLFNPTSGAYLRGPTSPYSNQFDPIDLFSEHSSERVNRFTGSVGADLRPITWLRLRGSIGLDYANSLRQSLARTGEAPNTAPDGVIGDDRTRYVTTSGDLGATVTLRRNRVSSRTSVGAQYVRSLNDRFASTGTGLPIGSESFADAAVVSNARNYSERVTLGTYLEQTFGLNERLFVNGALRLDGAAGFGRDYNVATYPKVGLSWLVSDEPFAPRIGALDELRVRYAFGASGQQPWPELSRPQYRSLNAAGEDGDLTRAVRIQTIGNPDLRPERVREHELGLDARLLEGRIGVSLTWNWRKTFDGIQEIQLPPGVGNEFINVGLIEGHGFELQMTGQVIRSRALTLDLTFNHSLQNGHVVSLGDAARFPVFGPRIGYPIDGVFARTLLGFDDANDNGVIGSDEYQVSDNKVYVGPGTPPRAQTLTVSAGGFDQRLRVTALLDRQSGFMQLDKQHVDQCLYARCRGLVDPASSLREQAEAKAGNYQAIVQNYYDGTFTRLREVAVSFDVPTGAVRALRLRNAAVTFSARNLALWTKYTTDPETRNGNGNVPLARSWVVRADLGF